MIQAIAMKFDRMTLRQFLQLRHSVARIKIARVAIFKTLKCFEQVKMDNGTLKIN